MAAIPDRVRTTTPPILPQVDDVALAAEELAAGAAARDGLTRHS